MTTPLHSTLKRALTINGRDYVVTLTEISLKLTLKGKRNGFEMAWTQMVSGEAALAVALQASVGAFAAKNAVTPTAALKDLLTQKRPSAKPGSATPRMVKPPTAKQPMAKPPVAKPPTAKPPIARRPTEKATTAKRSAPKPIQKTRSPRKG